MPITNLEPLLVCQACGQRAQIQAMLRFLPCTAGDMRGVPTQRWAGQHWTSLPLVVACHLLGLRLSGTLEDSASPRFSRQRQHKAASRHVEGGYGPNVIDEARAKLQRALELQDLSFSKRTVQEREFSFANHDILDADNIFVLGAASWRNDSGGIASDI
jgi:hypothetical protein